MIDRRGVLHALGLSLLAAPLIANAQPAGKVPRLGYLFLGAAGAESNTVEGLRQGLRDLGYLEGQTIHIEYRYADVRSDCQNWQRSSLASRWT